MTSFYEPLIIPPDIARARLNDLTEEEHVVWHSVSRHYDFSLRELEWKMKELCLLAARGNPTKLINYVDELGDNDKNALFRMIGRIDLLNIAQEFNTYSEARPGDDNDNFENDIFDTIFYIYYFFENDSLPDYPLPDYPLSDYIIHNPLQYTNPATGEFLGLRDPSDFIPSYVQRI